MAGGLLPPYDPASCTAMMEVGHAGWPWPPLAIQKGRVVVCRADGLRYFRGGEIIVKCMLHADEWGLMLYLNV